MRTFELERGGEIVADGVEWHDGRATIHWRGGYPSTVVWDTAEDAMKIHGHGGETILRWHEGPPPTSAEAEILDAWLLPGPDAPYHREMKNTVLLQWPALGQAIEHLVREHHRGREQD